jgi:hypothetical protein
VEEWVYRNWSAADREAEEWAAPKDPWVVEQGAPAPYDRQEVEHFEARLKAPVWLLKGVPPERAVPHGREARSPAARKARVRQAAGARPVPERASEGLPVEQKLPGGVPRAAHQWPGAQARVGRPGAESP